MSDLVLFVGRFHVLVVHLPIGILLLAVFLEIASRRPRFAAVAPALSVIWLVGALTALLALVVGYMHATEGGFDPGTVDRHRWSASALTLFAFAVWAVRAESQALFARLWPVCLVGVVGLLTLTGHYGGHLTHGPTYLVELAPGPLRAWAGLPPERPRPASLAEADIFLDVVAPALRTRCGSCHNDARRRGALVLTSHDEMLAGGESGPAITPGDAAGSDLIRRISLPPDDLDYMPKNGKPPLTEDEAAVLAWWIDAGAPAEGLVADLAPPTAAAQAMARTLGLPSPATRASTNDAE
jgi:hypothetical protein